jgi:hypothetical protein
MPEARKKKSTYPPAKRSNLRIKNPTNATPGAARPASKPCPKNSKPPKRNPAKVIFPPLSPPIDRQSRQKPSAKDEKTAQDLKELRKLHSELKSVEDEVLKIEVSREIDQEKMAT